MYTGPVALHETSSEYDILPHKAITIDCPASIYIYIYIYIYRRRHKTV